VQLGVLGVAAPASAADITIAWDPSPDPQEAILIYRVYARNVLLGETGGLVWTLSVTQGETLTIGVSTLGYYDADGDGSRETLGESTHITITHTVAPAPTEICGNGVDDDLDDQIDEGCSSPPPAMACMPPGQSRRADHEHGSRKDKSDLVCLQPGRRRGSPHGDNSNHGHWTKGIHTDPRARSRAGAKPKP